MTKEEYLKQRIKDLEKTICDDSIPMNIRKNQASALLIYREELEKVMGHH